MRFALFMIVVVSLVPACKPRNPEAGGLLAADDQPTAVQSDVQPGGDYHLSCQPADTDADHSSYELDVSGAVNDHDESQDVLVSVAKTVGTGRSVIADKLQGRGAVSVLGPVFVGFPMGVLTADAAPNGQPGAHVGVLTLAGDAKVDGLKVSCLVQKGGA